MPFPMILLPLSVTALFFAAFFVLYRKKERDRTRLEAMSGGIDLPSETEEMLKSSDTFREVGRDEALGGKTSITADLFILLFGLVAMSGTAAAISYAITKTLNRYYLIIPAVSAVIILLSIVFVKSRPVITDYYASKAAFTRRSAEVRSKYINYKITLRWYDPFEYKMKDSVFFVNRQDYENAVFGKVTDIYLCYDENYGGLKFVRISGLRSFIFFNR